jgi:hypothetical protein
MTGEVKCYVVKDLGTGKRSLCPWRTLKRRVVDWKINQFDEAKALAELATRVAEDGCVDDCAICMEALPAHASKHFCRLICGHR